MALSPASSHGGGFSIPSTTNSVPAGTRVIFDEFGDLIVVGVGGAGFVGVSDSPDASGGDASLSSLQGVSTKRLPIVVADAVGNVLGKIEERGYLVTAVHAAPADGDVGTGEAWLWYDDTNGAGKLMVKAKQADGTVKTGSFAVNT